MKKLLVARARLQIGIICVQKHNNKLPNNRAEADKSEGGKGLGSTYLTVRLQLFYSHSTIRVGAGSVVRRAGGLLRRVTGLEMGILFRSSPV